MKTKNLLKKAFLLLALMGGASSAWGTVYETYTVSLDNGTTVTPDESTFFTVASGGGYNTKYNGTYGGHSYSKGLKLNSNSSITFTTTVKSNITVVQSTSSNGTNNFKLGGQSVAHEASSSITIGVTSVSYTMTENTDNKYKEFVFTDVPATTGLALTNGGETGIFFVKVELTEDPSAVTQLDAPEITYVGATGTVTLGSVDNATKVTYTTDGTTPTALSDTYSDPFVVEDGTVVKAIAIGDGGSYSNSDIASETVYLTGITCATPVINSFNGAVAISTTTPGATIMYSINDGDYNTYTRSFTLPSGAPVKAYAKRTGCTNSPETSKAVSVLPTNKTKTIYLDYDDFTLSNENKTATGNVDTDANGYVFTMSGDKTWSSNGYMITTPAGDKKEFKMSNGQTVTLAIPDGVHVTKLTLYSIINSTDDVKCGWKEVDGTDYQTGVDAYTNVPMGSYSNVAGYNTNPDVRAYAIEKTGDGNTITFTNAGLQLCFVVALDILEDNTTITPANDKSTYVTTTALDFSGVEGLKAYVATAAAAGKVTLESVGAVPAGTPLMLVGTAGTGYTVPVAASASEPETNMFRAGDGTTEFSGTTFDYILYTDGLFYQIGSGSVPVGKAYLHCDSNPTTPHARELSISFGDDITGINQIDNGQLTIDNSQDGKFIENGKLVIVKNGVKYNAAGVQVK